MENIKETWKINARIESAKARSRLYPGKMGAEEFPGIRIWCGVQIPPPAHAPRKIGDHLFKNNNYYVYVESTAKQHGRRSLWSFVRLLMS